MASDDGRTFGVFKGSEEGTPPGDVLAEELETRGLSQTELAKRMRRPYRLVNEIVRGKKAITAGIALDLEGSLGIPASFWMNLESNYRLARARLERGAVSSHP